MTNAAEWKTAVILLSTASSASLYSGGAVKIVREQCEWSFSPGSAIFVSERGETHVVDSDALLERP